MDSLLRVSVASFGESGIGLRHELQMLKSAVLYADKVTLISPLASLYLPMEGFDVASTDGKLQMFFTWAESTGLIKEPFKSQYDFYRALARKKRRTRDELLSYERLRRSFEKAFDDTPLAEMATSIAEEAGTGQIKRAIEGDILSVQQLETYGDSLADQYMSSVLHILLDQTSYPLLDKRTGNLVDAFFNVLASFGLTSASGVSLSKSTKSRGTQVHLNHVFTDGVPNFPSASLDEIIDIRTELQNSLAAYRAAVIEFSHDVESVPWSKSFDADLDEIYRSRVAPQISIITEEVQSNRELRVLAKRATESPIVWGTAFGVVALAFQGSLDSLLQQPVNPALASGVAGAVLPLLFKSLREYKNKEKELRRNPLYLLSQTEALLSNAKGKH